jgi:DNA-binding response OmpR family regulator
VQIKSVRILVVDDDEGTRAYIAKVLSLKGWKVDTAGDGETGLSLVRKQAYDAVVLDYRMPGMNGAEVCRRVREIRPGIRPIFLTGFPTIDTVYPAIEGGADRVLAKSANLQELIGVLEEEMARTEPQVRTA